MGYLVGKSGVAEDTSSVSHADYRVPLVGFEPTLSRILNAGALPVGNYRGISIQTFTALQHLIAVVVYDWAGVPYERFELSLWLRLKQLALPIGRLRDCGGFLTPDRGLRGPAIHHTGHTRKK